jgi:glycosyltransferase involved in cell wall biosynthesis
VTESFASKESARGQERPGLQAMQLCVVVLTFNEEVNLPGCLESLQGLECARFIVDSGSTDRTVEIAAAHGATLTQHRFDNYAAQRNWALDNLPFGTPWVLHLDADERLTPEIVDEINAVLKGVPDKIAGFLLRKRTIFMGKWIRHGGHYPSYHLRLFRRSRGRCESRLYDQHFVVDGAVGRLKHDYLDVVSSSLLTWTTRHARWAAMDAREMVSPSVSPNQVNPDLLGTPIERRRWWKNMYGNGPRFVRAFFYWFYRYFLRLGFLDGTEGLIFHFLQGFWFKFLVDALIHESKGLHSPHHPATTSAAAQGGR